MKKLAIILAVTILGSSAVWACPRCHHHCHHHDYYRSDFSDAVALIALLAIGAGIAEQLQTTQQPTGQVERPLPPPSPRQTRTIQYPAASVYSAPVPAAVSHSRFVEPIQPIQPIQPVRFPVINFYNFGN